MKKKPILNVSLDRVWVEEEVVAPGTVKRSFFQERDERLERAYRHPPESPPKSRLALWCQEDYRGKPCNAVLAEVYATSEGDLWEARIEGAGPYDLEWRKMARPGSEMTKIPAELHAHHQWLDSGQDLTAGCARHDLVVVDRTLLEEALSKGKKHLHCRNGKVTFG